MGLGPHLAVAALNPRPKIREDVVFRKIPSHEETYVIVKDPVAQKYYKYDEWHYDVLALLDGTRDHEEITAEVRRKHPAYGIDFQWSLDFVEGLSQLGLLEKTEQERHLAMMDQLKTFRKKRFYDAERSTLFQIQIPLFDPDSAMTRLVRHIKWMWSPWFVAPWLVVFTGVLLFLLHHWELYWASFWSLLDVSRNTAGDWALLLFMTFATGMWHELGHGFTCKRYGGDVHSIGIMIFYMQPAFYCGIDDSYMFPKAAHRMYVAFGGSYFELMLCSIAMPFWLFTPAEWWIHEWALIVILLSGLSLIVFNLNPLIKLDGYYVLMDWLDVPNLREDSFEYIGSLIKKHLLRLETPPAPISRRRRRIFLVYGICSIVYTAMVIGLIYIWARNELVGWFGALGYLVLFGITGIAFRRQMRDAVRFTHHLWLDKKDVLLSPRGGAWASLSVLAVILLLTVPAGATRVGSSFTVEPARRAVVRAPADGFIRSVAVAEGTRVSPGDLLAVLESRELSARRDLAAAESGRALREVASARGARDAAGARQRSAEAAEAGGREASLSRRIEDLSLRAPISGIVVSQDLERIRGRRLQEGATFCVIDQLDTVRLAVELPEIDMDGITPGISVRVLPAAFPEKPFNATVLSVSPVTLAPGGRDGTPDLVRRSRRVRVLVEVGNPDEWLRTGMSGKAQFLTTPRSIAGKAWRQFHRFVASILW